MSVFTEEHRAFLDEWGYVVVPDVVPIELCDAVVETIFDFLGMNPENPEDWYREPLRPGGMIEIYQHQALWNTRQHPRMHQLFAELWRNEKLHVSIDRVGFKPPSHPNHPEYDHKGFLHWDTDTSKRPIPFYVQGVLALTDTEADMGGFQCVPGFHRVLEEWIEKQPPDRNPFHPDLTRLPEGMKPTPIPAKAGSMVIWNIATLHGNGHNVSQRPRFSQYISMSSASRKTEEELKHRVACWQQREPPGGKVFPGDPRRVEQTRYQTAELTPLGRKLLGVDEWE